MKLRIALSLFICWQFVCCTTTVAPDGTKTTKFDGDAFGQVVGGVVTVGGLFRREQPQEFTATK